MNDTPEPTPAIRETPSATYRRGQMSVWVKVIIGVLALGQGASIPAISYLAGKWDATQAMLVDVRERTKVLESWKESIDKKLDRIDEKLDRLLQAAHP